MTTFLHPLPGTPRPSPARTSRWAPLLGPPPTLFLQSEEMGREARKWDLQSLRSPSSQGPQPVPCRHPGWCEKGGGPGRARPLRQMPGGPQDGEEDRRGKMEPPKGTSKMRKAVEPRLPKTRQVRESRPGWRGSQQTEGGGNGGKETGERKSMVDNAFGRNLGDHGSRVLLLSHVQGVQPSL